MLSQAGEQGEPRKGEERRQPGWRAAEQEQGKQPEAEEGRQAGASPTAAAAGSPSLWLLLLLLHRNGREVVGSSHPSIPACQADARIRKVRMPGDHSGGCPSPKCPSISRGGGNTIGVGEAKRCLLGEEPAP